MGISKQMEVVPRASHTTRPSVGGHGGVGAAGAVGTMAGSVDATCPPKQQPDPMSAMRKQARPCGKPGTFGSMCTRSPFLNAT
jgi:hypothetical protein